MQDWWDYMKPESFLAYLWEGTQPKSTPGSHIRHSVPGAAEAWFGPIYFLIQSLVLIDTSLRKSVQAKKY